MLPFPTEAPFRLDQVTAAPLLMGGLFGAQVLLACAIHWAGLSGRRRMWRIAVGLLVGLVAIAFTLASWGNSDTTKLSHQLSQDLSSVRGEPFWIVMAPLIIQLPYRMSAMHGLVAAGYALAAILLARLWRAPAWAGWWSLLLCWSPLLRNFLQNGVTRQALATLLLLPLLLWAGRMAPVGRVWVALATAWSATVHTAFGGGLLLSLSPLLMGDRLVSLKGRSEATPARRRWLVVLGLLAALLVLIAASFPTALAKLGAYIGKESYFNTYPMALEAHRLQGALALGVLLTCWSRRLGWRELLACGLTRQLALIGGSYHMVQLSVQFAWYPQITTRFADVVGLFLLISFLAWLDHYHHHWAVIPALLVTLDYWLMSQFFSFSTAQCGVDDQFLCVPDRWPWQIRY